MNANYDFSRGRRGAVVPPGGNKVRITIRLDRDIVEWFKAQAGPGVDSLIPIWLRLCRATHSFALLSF